MEAQKNIFYKKGLGRFVFILLWLFYFPLAMLLVKKSEGLNASKLIANFFLFVIIWGFSILIISNLIG